MGKKTKKSPVRRMVSITDPVVIRRIGEAQKREHRRSFAETAEALMRRGLDAPGGE